MGEIKVSPAVYQRARDFMTVQAAARGKPLGSEMDDDLWALFDLGVTIGVTQALLDLQAQGYVGIDS